VQIFLVLLRQERGAGRETVNENTRVCVYLCVCVCVRVCVCVFTSGVFVVKTE
jgi:hypothetical protein